ncbi:MAG: hypothetical protein U0744_16995 [Gemmataceae bacterium]
MRKYAFAWLMVALAVPLLCFQSAEGQGNPNEREVRTQPSSVDKKGEVWGLDFRFKDPRLVKVNIPGRGTRICWYMWYQVINRTGEPRRFLPSFELVTHDYPGVYHDEVLPSVEEAIKKIEDPTGYLNIKNSVNIGKDPIPTSKPADEAFPKIITGVAIWDGSPADFSKRDPNTKDLSDATRFTIYVRGLSNGFVLVDPPAPGLPPITRYKTLQLNFRRTGDRTSVDSRDISFVPPAEWIYRAAGRKL